MKDKIEQDIKGNAIFKIFDKIYAEEELKSRTTEYLFAQIGRRRHRRMKYVNFLKKVTLNAAMIG